ncbi:LptF/LptG family permease [Pelagibacterium lentulum]|uniref:LPS export ABC transporter permease LptG n=1 Tax=Pelagibacterium lentulum TaxID=2029865 RepID=A0A916RBZ8_9HYPH|nr:LptF/LptG family permease [Pelagibacterium lentulum]GGA50426.1 LPS export ABC transporter permease LptG [Pelagibacterium lentulum]
MSKIGRLLCVRLASRIGLVVGILFGILLLVEFLDTWRFGLTADVAGPWVATWLAVLSAVRWSLLALPVTTTIGAIVGLIDLHSHREMVIISATGRSIWSTLKWPLAMVILSGVVVVTIADSVAIRIYQQLDAAEIGWGRAYSLGDRAVWYNQSGDDGRYVIYARTALGGGAELREVSIFRLLDSGARGARIHAESATLQDEAWLLRSGTILDVDQPARPFDSYLIATDATLSELGLQVGTAEDMSWFDLRELLQHGVTDPFAKAAAETRFQKLNALPALLSGSLLIAFAFTSGYRRAGHYGWTIIAGIGLGLLVFMITEMADRAGSAGVLSPIIAAWAPALTAIIIGLSVILRKEDGRV